MSKGLVYEKALDLARKGYGKPTFRRLSFSRFEWDLSGRCEAPVPVELNFRPMPKGVSKEIDVNCDPVNFKRVPITANLEVRCRKCLACRRFRAAQWIGRTQVELRDAQRSWFGTLTASPDEHFLFEAIARQEAARSAVVFAELSEDERFQRVSRVMYREIVKFWKRLRKVTGAKFRYICISEKHTDKLAGKPHFHFLLHEIEGTVLHRVLSEQWKLGFTNFKLVSSDASALYICKYLVKDRSSVVFASNRYGKAINQSG